MTRTLRNVGAALAASVLTVGVLAAPAAANASTVVKTGPGACDVKLTQVINGKTYVVGNLNVDGKHHDVLQPAAVAKMMHNVGFTVPQMADAAAVIAGESMFCPSSLHYNRNPKTGKITSTDYGLAQVNTKWHPEYTAASLYDPQKSIKALRRLWLQNGKSYSIWNAWDHAKNKGDWARVWGDQVPAAAKAMGYK